MSLDQLILVAIYGIISFLVFLKSLYESVNKKNSYGNTHFLYPLGIFVWGDGIIVGFFWTISVLVSIVLGDFLFFLVTVSVFWAVRSFGEMTYWFHQQFSPIIRNPAEKLVGYKHIKKDSIWFMYQVLWQCILVISLMFSIFLIPQWIEKLLH